MNDDIEFLLQVIEDILSEKPILDEQWVRVASIHKARQELRNEYKNIAHEGVEEDLT